MLSKRCIHHICIQTNHYQESIEFYTNALGFTLVQETKDFHNRAYNSWLQLEDFYMELQTPKKDEELKPYNKHREGIVHFCLWVEDLEGEVKRLKELGVTFLQKDGEDIYFVENGSLCKLQAPERTIVELRDLKGV
ncbi:VOC family protein [Rummeliibacillus pycnus]|uniref:VOC family protein n=1 Tax=Rummeliibacillus pycnus TaxID=101070 RepID=UPI001B801C87